MPKPNNYKTTIVLQEEYEEACEGDIGFCPDCKAFTRDMTEPDAEDYCCEICDNHNVVGAQQALILDWIDFKEEE